MTLAHPTESGQPGKEGGDSRLWPVADWGAPGWTGWKGAENFHCDELLGRRNPLAGTQFASCSGSAVTPPITHSQSIKAFKM